MKLLLISNMYPSKVQPTYGIFVKNFEEGILENGGTIRRAVIKGRGDSFVSKAIKYVKFFWDVIKGVIANDYDLVYVHYISYSLLPLVFTHRMIKKKLVVNAHGSDVFTNNKLSKLIQLLVKPVVQRADTVVVPSTYFMDAVSNIFSVDSERIFISPSGGVNTAVFTYAKRETPSSIPVLGYISRIDEGKGWDVLLDAVKKVELIIKKPFKVYLIGGGAQVEHLNKCINQLGLEGVVKYLGSKPQKDLPVYYSSFDVFIFPTRLAESLGLVGLEAMACGTPVIGANIGGLTEYIDNGVNGFLFEPGNSEDLSEKIIHFLNMPEDRINKLSYSAFNTSKIYDSQLVHKKLFDKLVRSSKSYKVLN